MMNVARSAAAANTLKQAKNVAIQMARRTMKVLLLVFDFSALFLRSVVLGSLHSKMNTSLIGPGSLTVEPANASVL
jgi:hypothetical protein